MQVNGDPTCWIHSLSGQKSVLSTSSGGKAPTLISLPFLKVGTYVSTPFFGCYKAFGNCSSSLILACWLLQLTFTCYKPLNGGAFRRTLGRLVIGYLFFWPPPSATIFFTPGFSRPAILSVNVSCIWLEYRCLLSDHTAHMFGSPELLSHAPNIQWHQYFPLSGSCNMLSIPTTLHKPFNVQLVLAVYTGAINFLNTVCISWLWALLLYSFSTILFLSTTVKSAP